MQIGRVIKWVAVGVAVLVVLAAIGVWTAYMLSCRVPGSYRPPNLGPEERTQAALEFINHKVTNDFGNRSALREPYDWTIDQAQVNAALASMDEIAYQLNRPMGVVSSAMQAAQVERPMVEFHDGFVRLMIRSTQYDRVISADVAFQKNAAGRWLVRLRSAGIGDLPVPVSMAKSAMEKLANAGTADAAGSASLAGRLAALLQAIVAAIAHDRPLEPVVVWSPTRSRMKVADVAFRKGSLSVHLEPIAAGQ